MVPAILGHIWLGIDELVVFSYEGDRTWVTGKGYELELSQLPEW
jgi:hypothetical protein